MSKLPSMPEAESRVSERDMVTALARYFARQGYLCRPFLRIHPREIDLVVLDPASLALITVEVKKADWRRAIPQVAVNLLYSHFTFIAVPRPIHLSIPPGPLDILGSGLIAFTYYNALADVLIERPPVASRKVNRFLQRRLYRAFRGTGEVLFHA